MFALKLTMKGVVMALALGALTGVASLSLGPAIRRPVGHRRCRVCRRMADEVADAADDALDDDEAELIEEAKEIARAKRSNMFNEDGVAYAPWLVDQVDEDAMMAAKAMRSMRKRQERDALEEKDGYVSLTEATTSELSGLGLKVRARARASFFPPNRGSRGGRKRAAMFSSGRVLFLSALVSTGEIPRRRSRARVEHGRRVGEHRLQRSEAEVGQPGVGDGALAHGLRAFEIARQRRRHLHVPRRRVLGRRVDLSYPRRRGGRPQVLSMPGRRDDPKRFGAIAGASFVDQTPPLPVLTARVPWETTPNAPCRATDEDHLGHRRARARRDFRCWPRARPQPGVKKARRVLPSERYCSARPAAAGRG